MHAVPPCTKGRRAPPVAAAAMHGLAAAEGAAAEPGTSRQLRVPTPRPRGQQQCLGRLSSTAAPRTKC
eukprot:7341033-Lingulodinium_polyedra.AAC.1